MADEQVIIQCAGCGVPILSWWVPDGGGLLRGEYVLVADTLWHPNCWDEQYAKYEQEQHNELSAAYAAGVQVLGVTE